MGFRNNYSWCSRRGWPSCRFLRRTCRRRRFAPGTKTVSLYATVTEGGRLVPGLSREDFEILDDGKPQALTVFSAEILPITVVVMLDTSGSMTSNIETLKAGAEQFFLRLFKGDRARLGAFNDKIQWASQRSGNRDELIASLRARRLRQRDAPVRRARREPRRTRRRRGAEGDPRVHRRRRHGEPDALRDGARPRAGRRGDGVRDRPGGRDLRLRPAERTRPDRSLKKLAAETGGGYFELSRADQLTSTFTRVALELHSQYVLGFSPQSRDGKTHKLEVRMKKPGMTARARKSYVAS